MSPVYWATSGHVKIKRAKEHYYVLREEIGRFFNSNPYGRVGYNDVETGDWVIRATVREQPDLRWGAIAGDAIHNLRSALDVLYGIIYPERRNSFFRFFKSAKDHKTHFARHEKPSRQAAMHLLRETKAYPGGNDVLCLLDTLDNENKHRTLIPTFGAVAEMLRNAAPNVKPVGPPFGSVHVLTIFPKPICPVEDGTELYRVLARDRNANVDMDPKFTIVIAFGELEVVKGKDILETLHKMTHSVEGVANAFIQAGLLA